MSFRSFFPYKRSKLGTIFSHLLSAADGVVFLTLRRKTTHLGPKKKVSPRASRQVVQVSSVQLSTFARLLREIVEEWRSETKALSC